MLVVGVTAVVAGAYGFIFGLRPDAATETVFTVASVPDTQNETLNETSVVRYNNRWNYLVQNKAALNLKYVWQVGDLQNYDNLIFSSNKAVNPRYVPGYPVDHYQYELASRGLKILETGGIRYSLAIGNHDTGATCQGGSACPVVAGQTQSTPIEVRNTKTWNKYYSLARLKLPPSQGLTATDTAGRYEINKSDNVYQTFTAGGLNWLVINSEIWPRSGVVDWMKRVAASHPTHNIILVTHSYLNGNGAIETTNGGYGATSPQYVHDNFVKQYANVRMTFSGHVGTSDYRVDTGVKGNKIYNFLDNYSSDTANNWTRLLTIDTQNNTIKTKVYAPNTKKTRTEAKANVNITGIKWVR